MRRTLSYFAAFVALGLTVASLGPTLQALATRAGVGYDRISLLFTSRAVGTLIGAYLFGRLYDRASGHPILAAAIISLAALMAVAPLPIGLGLMVLLFALVGLADSGIDVGGNTLTVWAHRERPGPYVNALHLSFGIGAFLAPVVVAEVWRRTESIIWVYQVMALLIALPLLLLAGTRSPRLSAAEAAGDSKGSPRSLVALLVIFLFLFVGAESSGGGWIYSYARAHGMEETRAAYATSVYWGGYTLSRLCSIAVAARLSPRQMLSINLAGALASIALLIIGGGRAEVIWAGAGLLGWFIGPVFPSTVALAGESLRLTGRVTSWFLVGAAAGAMFLPWLIGQFFARGGPEAVVWILLADLALASLLAAASMMRARRALLTVRGT